MGRRPHPSLLASRQMAQLSYLCDFLSNAAYIEFWVLVVAWKSGCAWMVSTSNWTVKRSLSEALPVNHLSMFRWKISRYVAYLTILTGVSTLQNVNQYTNQFLAAELRHWGELRAALLPFLPLPTLWNLLCINSNNLPGFAVWFACPWI